MAAMVVEKRSAATNKLARVFFPQIRILIPNSHVGVAECRFVTFHLYVTRHQYPHYSHYYFTSTSAPASTQYHSRQ